MSERFRLFVYGQLRRGEIGYERLGLNERTRWLGEASIRGLLYDLGDYPGLTLGGDEVVHGELLSFDDPALWAILDDFEDCDPAQPDTSEYRRVKVDLIEAGPAWAYIYNRAIEERSAVAARIWPRVAS